MRTAPLYQRRSFRMASGARVRWGRKDRGILGEAVSLGRRAGQSGQGRMVLGQSMFTPQNIRTSAPLPKNGPMPAGFMGASVFSMPRAAPRSAGHRQRAGIPWRSIWAWWAPGPAASWCRPMSMTCCRGTTSPSAGRTELKRTGILISYDHKWRSLVQTSFGGFGADATPDAGVGFGNVQTDAAVGLTLRFGRDFPPITVHRASAPGWSARTFSSPTPTAGATSAGTSSLARKKRADHPQHVPGRQQLYQRPPCDEEHPGRRCAGRGRPDHPWRAVTATEILRTREFVGQKGNDAFGGTFSISFNF